MRSLWTYYRVALAFLTDILLISFSLLQWYFLRSSFHISFTPGERRGVPPTTPAMPHVAQSSGLPGGACQWPRGSTYETAWRCPSTSGHRMASPTRPNRPVGRPFRLYVRKKVSRSPEASTVLHASYCTILTIHIIHSLVLPNALVRS